MFGLDEKNASRRTVGIAFAPELDAPSQRA
jgi:hypothetical protein